MTDATDTALEEGLQQTSSDTDLRLETKKFVLAALLDKAASVLPKRDTGVPVLRNFQIEAAKDGVTVVATDLELAVVARTEMVKVARAGKGVFDGPRLLEIVDTAGDSDFNIDVKKGVAHIAAGRASWDLRLADGTDYPPLPDVSAVEFTDVDRSQFLWALGAVRYAAGTSTVRPSLMMIDVREGRMRAADGVRFQQVMLGDGFPDLQLPIHAVDDLMRMLKLTELPDIGVGDSENHLVFRIGLDVFLANKLVDEFPDVDSVLLKPALANTQKLEVDRLDLIAAIKRVRVTSDPLTSAVVLSLDKDELTVSSKDKFGNTARETLDVKWSNAAREVAFNHVHLLDMLNMSDMKVCEFYLGPDRKTRKSPLMLRDENASHTGILNQIRIDLVKS